MPEESPAAEIPERFGPWIHPRRLDGGGQAEVFVVVRESDPGRVEHVLKALRPWSSQSKAKKESEQRGRFQREVHILTDLAATGCPGIVSVVDSDVSLSAPRPWYVMPLYSGPLSKNWGAYKGNIDRVLEVAEAVATTLAWLHGHEPIAVHRDVHAGNIFFEKEGGRVLLGDFGLVHVYTESTTVETGSKTEFGPWQWRPPELNMGSANIHNPKSDVYLLGGVIFGSLTDGEYIPDTELGGRFTHETDEFSIGRFTADERVGQVNKLLRVMLARDANHRITAAQVAEACRRIRAWKKSDPELVMVPSGQALIAAVSRLRPKSITAMVQDRLKELEAIMISVARRFSSVSNASSSDLIRNVSIAPSPDARQVGPDDEVTPSRIVITVRLHCKLLTHVPFESHVELASTSDRKLHVAVARHPTLDYVHVGTFMDGDPNIEELIFKLISEELTRLDRELEVLIESQL